MAGGYEQKPKTWALFPMSDEDRRAKEDFYDSKGWDIEKVPTHSGKLILEDGTLVRIEGRLIEGSRGDFFAGSLYIPNSQGGSSGGGADRGASRDRDRGRDDRGADRERSRGGDDRDSRRDDRPRSSGREDRSRPAPNRYRDELDDDVPF